MKNTTNDMKALLEDKFIAHYKLNHSVVNVDCYHTSLETFDLDEMPSPIKVLPVGNGKVTFKNNIHGETEIIPYEKFINQCKKPSSFLIGRKKCDYLLVHKDENGYSLLIELTSSLGNESGLAEPILTNKKNAILYSGGKYEKCVHQLAGSLTDLLDVPEIKGHLMAKQHRICLMAYRINPHTDPQYLIKHPFERYLSVESKVTAENGAIIPCPQIESLGFEYRRINHVNAFNL